jgi:hypothetical protein
VVATRIHGDDHNNPDHRRAGRAWNPSLVGARGGFMTGDSHPPDSPAVRFGDVRFEAPASRPPTNTRPGSVENIPLIVWTGELIRGENYAVIVPAVVESDHTLPAAGLPLTVGVRANRFAAAWRDAFAPNAVNAGAIAAIEERTRNAGRSFVTVGRSGDLDRPIGMDAIDAHTFGWNAVPIVLTYDRAEELLSQSVTLQTMQNGTTTESPLPRGTFFIEYRDHPDLAGHYTLFWQIERVESAPPM